MDGPVSRLLDLCRRHEALAITILFVIAATLFWTAALGFSPEFTLTMLGLGLVTAVLECGPSHDARAPGLTAGVEGSNARPNTASHRTGAVPAAPGGAQPPAPPEVERRHPEEPAE